jgi:hypothetical protein
LRPSDIVFLTYFIILNTNHTPATEHGPEQFFYQIKTSRK